jgi:translation initiation factor 5B
MTLKSPIVTVAGHVDHGKTTLLDYLRRSSIAEKEAGYITQKISFSFFPAEQLLKRCPIIEKSGIKIEIPGFLFVDTPGHAAFSNLRKRGGALADLSILVIDINEGIKPQTAEVIQILKHNKVPFIIAVNKIDKISGWQKRDDNVIKNIEMQAIRTKQIFDEKMLYLTGALSLNGFETDLFSNINDFTKKIALVPCSAKTGEGMPELLMMLCGLSQKYLNERLKLGKEAKGVILEIKKEKSINYAEAVLYDGELKLNDEIAIASFGEPIVSKMRILEEVQPLSSDFKQVKSVKAAMGIRMQLIGKSDIMPGMPFVIFRNNLRELKEQFKKEIGENIKCDNHGIIIKADSLGSLEALIVLLRQEGIKIVKTGIGTINKADVIAAKANLEMDELNAIILGFNVGLDDESKEILGNIKFFSDEVVYKLIEDVKAYRMEKIKEIEKQRLMELATICKLKVLHQYVFRNSNPAVFGVEIQAGKAKEGLQLIDKSGERIARVKGLQHENKNVDEGVEGQQLAMSLPGINFERQLKETGYLYADISERQFKKFKENKDLLKQSEIKALQEIAEIKRKKNVNWGAGS